MHAVEVQNLTFHYPQEKTPVLKDISFKVNPNEIVGIIGPSGCGKSTLMLAISGLIPHSVSGDLHGKVYIHGKNTARMTMAELSQTSQILFQCPESQLFALNVEDELTFGLENLNLPWREIERRRDNVLQSLMIDDIRHHSIEELSSGQKQRVALASLLAMEPKILLLDEPTANLDPQSVARLNKLVQELRSKHTIIIIEHNVEFIEGLADKVIMIDNGKVVANGRPKEVFSSKAFKKSMLPLEKIDLILPRIKKISSKTKRKIILEIKDLNFSYQNNQRILSDVHLEIGRGDFLGILGLNGSGKSTLALNIIGLLEGQGKIYLEGKEISKMDVFDRTKSIGYVFQNPNYQLFEENIFDEIAFGPKNLEINSKEINNRVMEALHITNLAGLQESDPHALSVGQKRRVSIASVLTMKPKILIIDEPDTGLDPKTAAGVMAYIKKLNESGMTIILISHNLELIARYCNRAVGMKNGKIVEPKEVFDEYLAE